jgi:hypothetical protein
MLNSQAFLAVCVYAALKKEAAGSSEMLIPIDQTISCHNLDHRDFTLQKREIDSVGMNK